MTFIRFSEWPPREQAAFLDAYLRSDEAAMRRAASDVVGSMTDSEWFVFRDRIRSWRLEWMIVQQQVKRWLRR